MVRILYVDTECGPPVHAHTCWGTTLTCWTSHVSHLRPRNRWQLVNTSTWPPAHCSEERKEMCASPRTKTAHLFAHFTLLWMTAVTWRKHYNSPKYDLQVLFCQLLSHKNCWLFWFRVKQAKPLQSCKKAVMGWAGKHLRMTAHGQNKTFYREPLNSFHGFWCVLKTTRTHTHTHACTRTHGRTQLGEEVKR